MADDMTHRSPQNRSQINLSEDYEVWPAAGFVDAQLS